MNLADTNVVVSLLLPSRDEQHREAASFVREHGPLEVGEAVLAECCWVLERRYRMKREDIASLLRGALNTDQLTAWDPALVDRALDLMEYLPRLSVVDCLLLSRSFDGHSVLTFDRRLQRALEGL